MKAIILYIEIRLFVCVDMGRDELKEAGSCSRNSFAGQSRSEEFVNQIKYACEKLKNLPTVWKHRIRLYITLF